MKIKITAGITGIALIILGMIAIMFGNSVRPRALVPGMDEAVDRALSTRLGSDHTIAPGTTAHLATFYTGKAAVEFHIIEGEFTRNMIDPSSIWGNFKGKSVHLINSVDEYQSIHEDEEENSSLSRSIGLGCALQSGNYVQLGGVAFQDCRGPYKEFGVSKVANIALVTYSETHQTVQPCELRFPEIEGDLYQQCLKDAVTSGLRDYFRKTRVELKAVPDFAVIPAIGTGIGHLHKVNFYSALCSVLQDEMEKQAPLPRYIYFLVYRADRVDWADTRFAIRENVGTLINQWNDKPHDRTQYKTAMLSSGATFLIGIISLCFAFAESTRRWLVENEIPTPLRYIQVCAGWIASTYALITVTQSVVPTSAIANISIGATMTFASWFLLMSKRRFEAFSLPQKSTSPGVSRPAENQASGPE